MGEVVAVGGGRVGLDAGDGVGGTAVSVWAGLGVSGGKAVTVAETAVATWLSMVVVISVSVGVVRQLSKPKLSTNSTTNLDNF